ncbi:putative nucleotidyltransferase substrate binding domain-containing protein [Pseudonocardia charpentierae]|uniref:Nucleotidyltransferase substrate binding domain-containing protein n=1 Tax=Pseudonocardia charpentierae TaxID=3075545 RepID=A0ABU2NGJ8_9PSEU|nr:putative nucleotidyltransferase substrate binding domain-containing protein [Pseudonocardia sp. DSM 45834]MDT0353092.1 putative nucleotidyltransferase substrate binding domain-containing protein [Pseudonocardia sp. DSM 45834]
MPAAVQVSDVDVVALAEFLGSCPPFDSVPDDELARMAAHAVVERYDAGAVILDAFDSEVEELFVVWEGRVDIWVHPDRVTELPDETRGVGDLFGFVAAITEAAAGPRATAVGQVTVIRLPAELVAPAFASRRGARFLAQEVLSTNRRTVGMPTYTLVDDLIARAPVVVDRSASIEQAASRMVAADLGYVAVRVGPGRYGLVTDATIRGVVAAARPTTTPVADVMSHDPPTVQLGASAAEALIKVLERNAAFVLVTDPAGELRGVVAPIDFVVSSTSAGAALHEQLRRANTVEELQYRYREVPRLVGDLMARGLASNRVITVHSALVDTLVRRAIQLVMQGRPDLDADAFTWLSLGSNGRREAVLSSDVDAAVAFADRTTADEIARYRPAFAEIIDVLTGAGIKHDTHGVSPVNPEFSRTHRQWESAARAWLSGPTKDNAVIMTCLLVDGRPIHGDLALPEVARVFGDLRLHPSTMRMLLAISVDRSDALRGRWRRKTIDLKRQALLPIANVARWAALSAGSVALPTPERLHAAAGSRMLSAEDADTLGDVFEIVQRTRLRHQLEQVEAGEPPSDVIALRDMSTIDTSVVNDAIREILAVQRRMANKAKFVPDLQDSPLV